MSSLTSYTEQDHHVQLYCSRLAQHTYEVCVGRPTELENQDFSVVNIWPNTQALQLNTEEEPGWLSRGINYAVSIARPGTALEQPNSPHQDKEEGQGQSTQEDAARQEPRRPSFYFDADRGQYRTAEGNGNLPEDADHPAATVLKTARKKLIEFLKTDEFFDEYSFVALMTFLLAHMFSLMAAIFAMGCNAPTIIDVFICVWRFMERKVEDIMATDRGSIVGCKCMIFSLELLVIFVCVFIFLWTVFIPVCKSLITITTKILSLFT